MWALLAAWIVLVSPCGAWAVTIDELPREGDYEVGSVEVEGLEHLSGRNVLKVVATLPPPWYLPWERWTKPVPFSARLFRTDLERIAVFLRESGYYEAEVTHDLTIEGDRIAAVITIAEGEPILVSRITLRATDIELDEAIRDALRSGLPLAPEDVFTQEAYAEGQARVQRHFLEGGYAYAEVARAARVDLGSRRARVTYTITRGEAAVFGKTTLGELPTVDPSLVRREITYEEGDRYDARAIERTQARVFGLGLFRSVTVDPTNLEARSGRVDMAIGGIETKPRKIEVGIGYGLEDQVRAQLRWENLNLFGGGRVLAFQLKGSSINQSVGGEFRQPHFLHPSQSVIVPLTQLREDEPGFTAARIALVPRIERQFPGGITASIGYGIEYDDLIDVPQATINELDEFRDSGYLSSVRAVLERNTAADLLDPRDGSVLNLMLEQAGGPWAGDFSFYSAILEAKRYVGLGGDRVLAGRARIGAADGFGQSSDVPIFRRFFLGGISSTRGYGRALVGPLNQFGSPVGGRSLLELNLEFRTPVYGDLGGVLFVDAGEVRKQPFTYTVGDLQYGVGAGVRYQTLVGPLRVDIGIPLDAPPGEPNWQIHFSIGQAF